MRKGYVLFIALVFAAAIGIRCAYTVSARLPLKLGSVYVAPFKNRTTEMLKGSVLTRYIREEILTRTSAELAEGPGRSTVVEGTIRKVKRSVVSEDSADRVLSEQLQITVNVSVSRGAGEKNTFRVQGVSEYENSGRISRELTIRSALKDASRKIVNRLLLIDNRNIKDV